MSKKGKVGLLVGIRRPKVTIAFGLLGLLGFGYVFVTRPSLSELVISEGRIIEQKVLEETLNIRKATDSKKRKLENVVARDIVASSKESDGPDFDLNRGGIIAYFKNVIFKIERMISKCEKRIEQLEKATVAPLPKKIRKAPPGDLEVSEDIPKKAKSVAGEQKSLVLGKINVAPLPKKIDKAPTGDLDLSEDIPKIPASLQHTQKKTGGSKSSEARTSDQVTKEDSRQTVRKAEKEAAELSSHGQEKGTTNSVSSIATWQKAKEMEDSSGQPIEKDPFSRAMVREREKKLELRVNNVKRVPSIARGKQKKKKLEKYEVIAQPGGKRSSAARAAAHSLEKVHNTTTKENFEETLPKRTHETVVVPQVSSTIAGAKLVSSDQSEAKTDQAEAKKNIRPDSIPTVYKLNLDQENASKKIRPESVRAVVKPRKRKANRAEKSVVQLKKTIGTAAGEPIAVAHLVSAAGEPIAVAQLVSADPAEATLDQSKTKKKNIRPDSIPTSAQENAKKIDGEKESSKQVVRRPLGKRMAVFDKLKQMSQSLRETLTIGGLLGSAAESVAGGGRDEYDNKYNLVHVFHTDFLQYQRELEHLRAARFLLFNAFTLPSMRQQQNQDFLWMIWVDPKIQDDVAVRLLQYLGDMPNVVVLRYFRDKKKDFRDLNGIGNDNELQEAFLAGNAKLFMEYYEASQSRLLLETRLDADDALHRDFTESIQREAFGTIGKSDVDNDFRIFCAEHHVEWRYYKPSDERNEQGHLVHYHNPTFCINSGLTIAYQIRAKTREMQTLEQCNMHQWYQKCSESGSSGGEKGTVPIGDTSTTNIHHFCVARARILMDEQQQQQQPSPSSYQQVVLMARTPTSAGMKRVVGTEKTYKATYESMAAQEEAWHIMEHDFGATKAEVMQVRRSMEGNIRSILREALIGQCMPGHSCKAVTKRKLVKLLENEESKMES